MAAASAAAILASCSAGGQKVVVTNDTDLARENETVELCFKGLQNADAALTEENVVVLDQAGNQVARRMRRDEQSAGGIGKIVSHFQIGHDAAHHQGQRTVAEKGKETGEERLLILPVKLLDERKHGDPPLYAAIVSRSFSIA